MKKAYWWIVSYAVCIALTPAAAILADRSRGYDGMGGEYLVPFLPALAWLLWGIAKDTIAVVKMEGREVKSID